jgi:hypothetical protein
MEINREYDCARLAAKGEGADEKGAHRFAHCCGFEPIGRSITEAARAISTGSCLHNSSDCCTACARRRWG